MSNELTKKEQNALQKKELTASERFTNMVINEFQGNIGELNLNEYQKQLIRNYFIGIDNALKNAETSRQYSSKKKDDPTFSILQNILVYIFLKYLHHNFQHPSYPIRHFDI